VVNNLTAMTTGQVRLESEGPLWRPLMHIEHISRPFLAMLEALLLAMLEALLLAMLEALLLAMLEAPLLAMLEAPLLAMLEAPRKGGTRGS
jgi:hypothetical protein